MCHRLKITNRPDYRKHPRTTAEWPSVVGENEPRLQVLLIYEDLSAGLRARRVFEQAIGQLGPGVDFDLQLCNFDRLCQGTSLTPFADPAAKADIVFLSLHGRTELPPGVKLWIKKWLARNSCDPGALAISLDSDSPPGLAETRTLDFIHNAARATGVEIFVHRDKSSQVARLSLSRGEFSPHTAGLCCRSDRTCEEFVLS